MSWVNALAAADINEIVAESVAFDAKTAHAMHMLMLRLRRVGSLPADDEKLLAQVARCTRNFWVKRAWPALREVFEVRDGRLYHPEIRGWRVGRESDSRDSGPSDSPRREIARQAAAARWEKERNLRLVGGADLDAGTLASMRDLGMHDASSEHASMHASAMRDASETDASMHAGRIDASVAPAGSLSKKESTESEKEERECAGARASGADASDASADASMHAPMHHASDASARRPRGPLRVPLPADWAPSAAAVAEVRARGVDPDELAARFVLHYRARGELRADWEAQYLAWGRTEPALAGRQRHLTMALQGGQDPPQAPLSEAERALKGRLQRLWDLWGADKGRPVPPSFDTLREAGADGIAWLESMEAWDGRGAPPPRLRGPPARHAG